MSVYDDLKKKQTDACAKPYSDETAVKVGAVAGFFMADLPGAAFGALVSLATNHMDNDRCQWAKADLQREKDRLAAQPKAKPPSSAP